MSGRGWRAFQAVTGVLIAAAAATAVLAGAGDPSASAGFQVHAPDPGVTLRALERIEALQTPDPASIPANPDAPGRSSGATKLPKVWIYFTDKAIFDSETCGRRLESLGAALAPKIASRRAKSMPAPLVDFLDIPVDPGYVSELERMGVEVVHESHWLNAVSARAPVATLRAVATLPFVQKIDLVRGGPAPWVPVEAPEPANKSRRQTGDLFNYGPSRGQLEEIHVLGAQLAGYSGAGTVVAMLDTGFDYTHIVFQDIVSSGRLLAQWDFVNDDGEVRNESGDFSTQDHHGTYTWSVLGGFHEGELVGPAYGASFLLAKTEDLRSETPLEEDNWIAAAEWADSLGADVISSSLGYNSWYTYEDMDGNTAPITIAADIAVSRGIVVCNSAGNERGTAWVHVIAPADGDSVIAVGAVDSLNQITEFSSEGPTYDGRIKPEVVARGLYTYCAGFSHPERPFARESGTSLSCPLVAGAAALVIEAHPDWSPMMIRHALLETADNAFAPDNDRGWGRINTVAAIDFAFDGPTDGPGSAALRLTVQPNPSHGVIQFGFDSTVTTGRPGILEIFDPAGRKVRSIRIASGNTQAGWNGRDEAGREVGPGLYFARVRFGPWRATAKLVRDG